MLAVFRRSWELVVRTYHGTVIGFRLQRVLLKGAAKGWLLYEFWFYDE